MRRNDYNGKKKESPILSNLFQIYMASQREYSILKCALLVEELHTKI